METLEQLKKQIELSKREITILDPDAGKKIKTSLRIPEDTLLGEVVYGTGGIVFENCVRLLASGERDIAGWNDLINPEGYFIVADDIFGGLFGLSEDRIHYFAPDTLAWEDLGMDYPQFVQWLIGCDMDIFYKPFRWENWREEIVGLNFSQGIAFYPFLWAKPNKGRLRQKQKLHEIVLLSFDAKKQIDSQGGAFI